MSLPLLQASFTAFPFNPGRDHPAPETIRKRDASLADLAASTMPNA
jgi:hypothetical protein